MYLLVFVTIVISLIGVYAQILTVQTARLASGQATIAQAMLTWHATAIAEARYGVYANGPYIPDAFGCSLTVNFTPVNDSNCQGNNGPIHSIPIVTRTNQFASLPDCTTTAPVNTPPCWTGLPPGYRGGFGGAANPYTFFSMYYSPAAGQRYVITFVPAPALSATNPAPGLVKLPGDLPGNVSKFASQQVIGITMAELLKQLHNAHMPPFAYGVIQNKKLTTVAISPNGNGSNPTSFSFNIPTDGCPAKCTVPDGSIAIISTP